MQASSVFLAVLAFLLPVTVVAEDASVKYIEAAGARFPYVEEGDGEPILFIHGAFSDHRAWDAMRETVAESYRFMAYTQRGFGTADWPEEPGFASDVHEDDLVALLDAWAQPMHLVAWSYGGPVALRAAIERPDLVRSVVIFEPGLSDVLEGKPEHEQALAAWRGAWGPTVEAMQRGDNDEAISLAIEYVWGLPQGGFEQLPEESRRLYLENAHTVPKIFAMPPPRPMTCEDLGSIQTPVLIIWGTETLPYLEAVAKEVAACIPNAKLEEIHGAKHSAPMLDHEAFLEKTLSFIRKAGGS
jgi:pimeloyl-ACP methyl ester carboxylesterase